MDELSSNSQQKPGPVVFLRYRLVCLKLRLFANPKASIRISSIIYAVGSTSCTAVIDYSLFSHHCSVNKFIQGAVRVRRKI